MYRIELKEFPTTRYQGSKRKILPWIYSAIKDLKFETALDAFGGSASVSYLFKKMNKSITYNDKLYFNFLIGKAIIENEEITLSETDLDYILKENEKINYNNFIQSHFKNVYFLEEENIWLDKVVSNITQMNHYEHDILQFKKCMAYYALFQSSIIKRPFNLFHRNNLSIRTSDVERNFGNKTTWDKSFKDYFIKFSNEGNSLVFNSGKKCQSINQSAFNIDPYGFDLVYLDPPYMKRNAKNESSNYLKCYHFLEGLSKYQSWESLIDYESTNLRFKQKNDDNDFKLSNINEIYEKLIYNYRKSIIVLSYKKEGAPSIDFLMNLVKKIKGNSRMVSKHYKYALNHQNGDAKNNREVLIIGV